MIGNRSAAKVVGRSVTARQTSARHQRQVENGWFKVEEAICRPSPVFPYLSEASLPAAYVTGAIMIFDPRRSALRATLASRTSVYREIRARGPADRDRAAEEEAGRKREEGRKKQPLMNMHVARWIGYYIIRGEVTESWTNFGGFKSTSTVGWFKKLPLERGRKFEFNSRLLVG